MTIIFFARRFYPLLGGVEKHVFEISSRFIKKGHRVIVVTEHTSRFPLYEKVSGIEIYRIKTGKDNRRKKFVIWRELWKLRGIISQADIIHCHDVFFWYLPFRFLYPRKCVFITFHGYESYPISRKAKVIRKMSEKLSKGNICIGDFIKKWYGTNADYISYGAVDSSKVKNKNSKYKKESAVFIGRLDNQTGILTYVKSIQHLRKNYPGFVMTVAGDGVYKNKIAKQVNVLGFQKNPEKYFDTHHFAFVSRYLAILEAFAAKRLVFAVYDNPVKEDYLKMAPFAKYMIIAATPEQVAKEIIYILKNPLKEKKLIENAYTWVQKQSWEKMVSLYENLWKHEHKI